MRCKVCQNYIPFESKKCHHCGEYQNWRRPVNSLSFLFAFFASAIAVWPFIAKIWRGDYVEVSASIVKSDQRGMSILVDNRGTMDAGVRRAYIDVYGDGEFIFTSYLETMDWELLKTKKSQLIVAKAIDGQVPIYADPKHNNDIATGDCTLHIELVSSHGIDQTQTLYPCYLASLNDKADFR